MDPNWHHNIDGYCSADIHRMYHILLSKSFWTAIFFSFNASGNSQPAILSYSWENEFIVLGYQIAHVLNLGNCWVCGSPGGSKDWPCLASLVLPKWWVSNLSDIRNGSGFSTEEGSPWRLKFSGKGTYCLNWIREKGVPVGQSTCEWTLSPSYDCVYPECKCLNCSR